ncbi:hypothetical protein F511_43811 [Dorcoceras hygrometricum]|uniref:Uncharacterized protein n=1 Tax=Dorcoceras hygrometricum TaxID=472368 RepID=A0A2Z7A3K2_9LAMI|nr:hypothetical protein F511_43811 [Dorcoceras hygrometricum]
MCARNVAHHARHHRALVARWTAPGRTLAARLWRVGRAVVVHWLHEMLADDARHQRALVSRWTAPGRTLAARLWRVGRAVVVHWLHEMLADDGRLCAMAGRCLRDAWPLRAAGCATMAGRWERWERDGGRTMRHWLAHPVSCAALVTAVRGLCAARVFLGGGRRPAMLRRCRDG